MAWVVSGLLNKQIAGELGISEETVKVHRGHVMRKMGADSLAELVRMSERLGMPTEEPVTSARPAPYHQGVMAFSSHTRSNGADGNAPDFRCRRRSLGP